MELRAIELYRYDVRLERNQVRDTADNHWLDAPAQGKAPANSIFLRSSRVGSEESVSRPGPQSDGATGFFEDDRKLTDTHFSWQVPLLHVN
jgi:hypothetical protein